MKVLFDTNVILDVLLNREPFAADAICLLQAVEHGAVEGFLCATTLTTIDYLATKTLGKAKSRQAIGQLLRLFSVAPVNEQVLTVALVSEFADFEDAVLYASGLFVGMDALVTRNVKDFTLSTCPVHKPESMCQIVGNLR